MTITVTYKDSKTDYEVIPVGEGEFKSSNFPPPAMGRNFYLDGTPIEVETKGDMKEEDNQAMFYYSYQIVE